VNRHENNDPRKEQREGAAQKRTTLYLLIAIALLGALVTVCGPSQIWDLIQVSAAVLGRQELPGTPS
jgi:hypothetical protein